MGVTVVIGTYGDKEWARLALTRAAASAWAQAPVICSHRRTLTEARNDALNQVETEWVIHLDADDELEPGYVEALEAGTADVRTPIARYVDGQRENLWQPRVAGHHHNCEAACLPDGNWLLVGAMVRTELLKEVGGWRDFDWSEDWDLWLRCYLTGATFELIPEAVYRAHVRHDSRNRGATAQAKQAAHEAIYRANFP